MCLFVVYFRQPVTVFKYGIGIKGKEAGTILTPSSEDLSRVLTPVNGKIASVARKNRKLYLVGAKANLNYTAVAISLRMGWSETNAGKNTC